MNEQALNERFTATDRTTLLPEKRSFLWPLFIFFAGLLIGCLPVFYKSNFVALLQLAGFLLLGFFYSLSQRKNLQASGGTSLWTSAVFCVALILITAVLSYFAHALRPTVLVVSACAFLFPNAVAAAWWAFYAASVAPRPLWFYSKDIPEEAPFVYLEKKNIRLRVLTGNKSAKEYRLVIPGTVSLGQAFFYSIKSGRKPEEWRPYFLNETGLPYGWVFYTTKFGLWKTYLQANETIFENDVDSNSIIIAKRLTEGEKAADEPH